MKAKYDLPFVLQYDLDIDKHWQDRACGIASVLMVIEFYLNKKIDSKELFDCAMSIGAYLEGIGFKHKELAKTAENYGLSGENFDWAKMDQNEAFDKLTDFLKEGPIIVSIYSKFDPENKGGHLIVLTGFDEESIFYNDPQFGADKSISTKDFLKGWKQRIIAITKKIAGF